MYELISLFVFPEKNSVKFGVVHVMLTIGL